MYVHNTTVHVFRVCVCMWGILHVYTHIVYTEYHVCIYIYRYITYIYIRTYVHMHACMYVCIIYIYIISYHIVSYHIISCIYDINIRLTLRITHVPFVLVRHATVLIFLFLKIRFIPAFALFRRLVYLNFLADFQVQH